MCLERCGFCEKMSQWVAVVISPASLHACTPGWLTDCLPAMCPCPSAHIVRHERENDYIHFASFFFFFRPSVALILFFLVRHQPPLSFYAAKLAANNSILSASFVGGDVRVNDGIQWKWARMRATTGFNGSMNNDTAIFIASSTHPMHGMSGWVESNWTMCSEFQWRLWEWLSSKRTVAMKHELPAKVCVCARLWTVFRFSRFPFFMNNSPIDHLHSFSFNGMNSRLVGQLNKTFKKCDIP